MVAVVDCSITPRGSRVSRYHSTVLPPPGVWVFAEPAFSFSPFVPFFTSSLHLFSPVLTCFPSFLFSFWISIEGIEVTISVWAPLSKIQQDEDRQSSIVCLTHNPLEVLLVAAFGPQFRCWLDGVICFLAAFPFLDASEFLSFVTLCSVRGDDDGIGTTHGGCQKRRAGARPCGNAPTPTARSFNNPVYSCCPSYLLDGAICCVLSSYIS